MLEVNTAKHFTSDLYSEPTSALWLLPQSEMLLFAVFYCQTVVALIFVCIDWRRFCFFIVFYCLFMRFSLCSTFAFL